MEDGLEAEIEQLRAEMEAMRSELAIARSALRQAKDPTPVERPSLKRVLQLAREALLTVERCVGGWLLKMGRRVRRFRFLRQIWEILIQEEFLLSDIFPPECFPEAQPRLPVRNPVLAPAYGDVTFAPTRIEGG